MILIVGESASGKSTIETIIADKYGYEKSISYTTREPRANEKDGESYFFVSEEKFKDLKTNFVEIGRYKNYLYGTPYKNLSDNTVLVVTPHGMRQIKKKVKDLIITTFYLQVPRKDRLISALKRGDDVDEVIRRNQTDVGQFDGIEDEVDCVIKNNEYELTPEEIAEMMVSLDKINRRI